MATWSAGSLRRPENEMTSLAVPAVWRDWVSPRDVRRVGDLVAATDFFNREEQEIAIELVHERLERGAASGYSFLFAEEGADLTGFACYGHTPGTAASYDLYWIVVAPRAQRTGIGSRLLCEIESRVRVQGGVHIWVETSGRTQYQPTRDFYLHRGYRRAARLRDFYAPGDDKLILTKRLHEPT